MDVKCKQARAYNEVMKLQVQKLCTDLVVFNPKEFAQKIVCSDFISIVYCGMFDMTSFLTVEFIFSN